MGRGRTGRFEQAGAGVASGFAASSAARRFSYKLLDLAFAV